ncbi:hypothetical protein T484DRAFT_1826835 [Baffinella frigidus]|nr:hypothetical protein T484DRAFT_1826835 [Cryptophyta sp. CCMP2293]
MVDTLRQAPGTTDSTTTTTLIGKEEPKDATLLVEETKEEAKFAVKEETASDSSRQNSPPMYSPRKDLPPVLGIGYALHPSAPGTGSSPGSPGAVGTKRKAVHPELVFIVRMAADPELARLDADGFLEHDTNPLGRAFDFHTPPPLPAHKVDQIKPGLQSVQHYMPQSSPRDLAWPSYLDDDDLHLLSTLNINPAEIRIFNAPPPPHDW